MDTNSKSFEQLVREEAYRIWEWRTSFNPPFPGDDISDWEEAKDNLEEERRVGLITNRIGKYY